MTQKIRTFKKTVLRGEKIKSSYESSSTTKTVNSIQEIGAPFHIMGKEDIEKELSRIKEIFNMTPDDFYKAWKEDKVRGFQALKFGCLYEYYRNESA